MYTLHCIQIIIISWFLQNLTCILYITHPIYLRSGTIEKQTQGLLDVPSRNLIEKEHFRTQALMKKLIFLEELFLIFFKTLFHMKQLYVMTKIHPGSKIE